MNGEEGAGGSQEFIRARIGIFTALSGAGGPIDVRNDGDVREVISPTRVLFKATHISSRTVERWLGWRDDQRHEEKYLSADDLNEHLTSIYKGARTKIPRNQRALT